MVRSHAILLLLGTLMEHASGFAVQSCVRGISGCGRSAGLHMINKDAGLSGLGTQAMAAMAAAMISTSGVSLVQPFVAPAFAANGPIANKEVRPAAKMRNTPESKKDINKGKKTLYKNAFEQSEKLSFSELGWGDSEAQVLSQALYGAKGLKKLSLNDNAIQDDGALALAASLKEGAAPKLKTINLAGNRGITETDKRALRDSRKGLVLSFAPLKQASDADVYKRADEDRLKMSDVITRAEKGQLVDGSGATCAELVKIIEVDRATLDLEKNKLKSKVGKAVYSKVDPVQIKKAEAVELAVEKQVQRLDELLAIKTKKGCNIRLE